MGRDKIKRNYKFKPKYKEFKSTNCDNCTTIHLLAEEIEAVYLMDVLNLYQADAAKKMGVSRPTIARVIKNARQKIAMMLISGATLKIEDEKEDYTVAIASNHKEKIKIDEPDSSYIHIYHIHQEKIEETKVYQNPVIVKNLRPGQILPQFFNDKNVNFFITKNIGSGLKEALKSKGIFSVEKNTFKKEMLFKLGYD